MIRRYSGLRGYSGRGTLKEGLDRLARAFGRLPDGPLRRAIVQMVLGLVVTSGNARSRGRVEDWEDSVE
jgi:hypothetical protein